MLIRYFKIIFTLILLSCYESFERVYPLNLLLQFASEIRIGKNADQEKIVVR